ncbi:hypothetical protein BRAFLDRAFT_70104, partial [Paramuricea clavata]
DAQMPCITHLENLETALEYARTVFHRKPHIILARMLNNLGNALSSKKSLEYLQEGKEMMDEILGPNHVHPTTLEILNNVGIIYLNNYGDFAKAFQFLQDALRMNSVIYGDNSANHDTALIYENIAFTAKQMGNLKQAKEYYTEAVKIRRKIRITKDSCDNFLDSLFCLNMICGTLDKEDEALKFLEEAREVAKVVDYKGWKVVVILHELTEKYINLESVVKSEICNEEAREMARNLPENDSPPHSLFELIESLKN